MKLRSSLLMLMTGLVILAAPAWSERATSPGIRGPCSFIRQTGSGGTGPDTRTTQLYINLADNTHLDAQGFAPLGRVVEGMEVVDGLYAGYDEGAGGGMRGGKQGKIFSEGNAHLDRDFPELTRLVRATIE